MTMTRAGKRATKEQRAASECLGSLDDALARWAQSTGPTDAYEMAACSSAATAASSSSMVGAVTQTRPVVRNTP